MISMTTTPKRPVLRYHGGKWRLAPWIIGYFSEHRVYVEPFAGAASVLLRKPPSPVEVYNDLDERVVSLFRILRDPDKAERLRLLLNLTPISRAEHRFCRYPCGEEIEDARRLIVRSFQGVGAAAPGRDVGWRTRFKLRLNYQMSWNGWPDQVPIFVERLKEVLIESLPWEDAIDKYDDDDTLFYVDPPYVTSTRSQGMLSVYGTEMTDADHQNLLSRLIQAKGKVVLSGYANPMYCDMLSSWRFETKSTRAQAHALRTECLWIKP